jgi:hypothetical protein
MAVTIQTYPNRLDVTQASLLWSKFINNRVPLRASAYTLVSEWATSELAGALYVTCECSNCADSGRHDRDKSMARMLLTKRQLDDLTIRFLVSYLWKKKQEHTANYRGVPQGIITDGPTQRYELMRMIKDVVPDEKVSHDTSWIPEYIDDQLIRDAHEHLELVCSRSIWNCVRDSQLLLKAHKFIPRESMRPFFGQR